MELTNKVFEKGYHRRRFINRSIQFGASVFRMKRRKREEKRKKNESFTVAACIHYNWTTKRAGIRKEKKIILYERGTHSSAPRRNASVIKLIASLRNEPWTFVPLSLSSPLFRGSGTDRLPSPNLFLSNRNSNDATQKKFAMKENKFLISWVQFKRNQRCILISEMASACCWQAKLKTGKKKIKWEANRNEHTKHTKTIHVV